MMIEGLTLADDDVDDELQTEDDDTQDMENDTDATNASVENMKADEQDINIDKDELKEIEDADAKDLEADYAYIKSKAHKQTYSKEEQTIAAEKYIEMANNNNTTDTLAYANEEKNEGGSSINKEKVNLEQDGEESDDNNYEVAVENEEQEVDIRQDREPKKQYKDKGTLKGVAIDKSLIQKYNNTGEEPASIDGDDDDDDKRWHHQWSTTPKGGNSKVNWSEQVRNCW